MKKPPVNKSSLIIFTTIIFTTLSLYFPTQALRPRARKEIKIPAIPGYQVLKCDFHMHTVFSDGEVSPYLRVEEAWREGLDAVAITEHIETEYHSYPEDLKNDLDRPHELAREHAEKLGVILIRGGEITRDMPPGHFNALFLKDVNALDRENFHDAVKAAVDQGAFISWNHPGWTGQQPDGVSRWYTDHEELLKKGRLHGIEVVNFIDYYPRVHQWCLEKNLTLLGNSDIHDTTRLAFEMERGEHRPMTLVFAEERSTSAIKAALFARRTAVYYRDRVIGEKKFLEPLFAASIEIIKPIVTLKGKERAYIQVRNKSEIPFELVATSKNPDIEVPEKMTLPGDAVSLIRVRAKPGNRSVENSYSLPYTVKNLLVAPGKGLPVILDIQVQFLPKSE